MKVELILLSVTRVQDTKTLEKKGERNEILEFSKLADWNRSSFSRTD